MKKIIILSAVAATLLSVSCQRDELGDTSVKTDKAVFTATIENPTKTTLNGLKVEWAQYDTIAINGKRYVAASAGDNVSFTAVADEAVAKEGSPRYMAYYPAKDSSVFPAVQQYEAGQISNNPMYAASYNQTLVFRNICGLLEFTLKGTATVKKIEISADQALAGKYTVDGDFNAIIDRSCADTSTTVTLNCGSGVALTSAGVKFYVALPAGTYTNLKVAYTDADGLFATVSAKTTVTVDRNTLYQFPAQTPQFKQKDMFCFTAVEAGTVISMVKDDGAPDVSLQYSEDGVTWETFTVGTTTKTLANVGDKVYFRATASNTKFYDSAKGNHFSVSAGKADVGGNIMYLLNGTSPTEEITEECALANLFASCTGLRSAEGLNLPATTLAPYCYQSMFNGCTSLECAPELPAMDLAEGCYGLMFNGCTSLESAPELPATDLATGCYGRMFDGCTNLSYVKCLATDTDASYCTLNWLQNVADTGTFVKAEGKSWGRGASAIPESWLPILPSGSLEGKFSIADGTQIYFSPGNLYYNGVTKAGLESGWNFYHNQYDCQTTIAADQEISLFTWGVGDWSTVWNTQSYLNSTSKLTQALDWGSKIGDGIDWRTLTKEEWDYLISRSGKVGYATVGGADNSGIDGVKGIIILPDNFTDPCKSKGSGAFAQKDAVSGYNANVYTKGANWDAMVDAGAVFLPAAGTRDGETLTTSGSQGFYWASTPDSETNGQMLNFESANLEVESTTAKSKGCSVRLIYVPVSVTSMPSYNQQSGDDWF